MRANHLKITTLTCLLLLLAIDSAEAQWATQPRFGADTQVVLSTLSPVPAMSWTAPDEQVNTASLATNGVLGAAVGTLVGLSGGLLLDMGCCNYDGSVGPFVGAAAGMAIATPIMVHLSNQRQGRLEPALLAATGISALGFAAFLGTGRANSTAISLSAIVGTLSLQTFSAVKIERYTSRAER